jgi:tetratricopeptide (TPR) repeat protein
MGRRLGQAYNLYGRGLALLEANRLAEAGEALHAALTIRTELGEQTDRLETLGALALLALAQAELESAQRIAEEMLALLVTLGQIRPALRQWVHYAAYRMYQSIGDDATAVHHLGIAQAAMLAVAAPLAQADRRRFLGQVPLNRQVEAATAEKRRRTRVCLARLDAPLGRSLTAADTIEITWTTYSPEDDLHVDPAARRHYVIKRLLAEANSQSAAPTGDDLAAALAVSRRTILRDMKVLAAAGVALPGRQKTGETEKHK